MNVKKRLAVARVYARAAASLFDRVATALSNLGLEGSRYQIIRNQMQQCGLSPIRRYRELVKLHNILISP